MSKSSTAIRIARFAAALATTAGSAGLLAAGAQSASAQDQATHLGARHYSFTTLDDAADPTFNQLLGIDNAGVIVGYFGSGAQGHPNMGYELKAPYSQPNFINENFPGSIQTQVTAINSKGDTAGFWVDAGGVNHGFVEWNGVFTSYDAPHSTFTQILGLNKSGTAVGVYTDASGVNHGFKLNQATGVFTNISVPGTNTTASSIDNKGDITGFTTGGNGETLGWLIVQGRVSEFEFPGSTNTTPFGINDNDEIVGSYVDANNVTHGFTLKTPLRHATFATVDDPNGIGGTVINGLNDTGSLVGFYTDAAGNVNGLVALP